MKVTERDTIIARDLLLAAGWDRDEFVRAIAEALAKAREEGRNEALGNFSGRRRDDPPMPPG